MISRDKTVRRTVVFLLVFGVLLLLGAYVGDAAPSLHWPWLQEHSEEFYMTKGLVSAVAVVLVIVHMSQVWRNEMMNGQRLRYMALFYLIALVAYASVEQAQQDIPVNVRNVGGLGGALFVIVAMVVSMNDTNRGRRP